MIPNLKVCWLICSVVTIAACGNSVNIEPGVSLQLAQHRAQLISDVHYQLTFDIPAQLEESIPAEVAVSFQLADASEDLQLDFRASGDRIRSVSVNSESSEYEFQNEHVVIPADELVNGKNRIEIELFAGDSSLNRNPDYLYTLFVPDRARTAFPLFDQPDIKATYELTLIVPEDWRAMSNAPLGNVEYFDGKIGYQFQRSGLISSYLFSFVAGQFEQVSREVGGRSMTMLHRESDAEKVNRNVDDVFSLHAASLAWLEEYTGISYPWQKFDFALIPGFQYGGMEHVGAIQYRASALFLDPAPSDRQLLRRASLIAHETAHMWFGNLVTMEWFNDVWTKEVFASFMAAKIVNPSFPEINHDLNFLIGHHPAAYSVDRTEGANPIRQDLANLNEAGQMYGAIIYNKAPIMMRQLEVLIGADAFQSGMRAYLRRHSFANATWPKLIEILDDRSSIDLKAWSETWVTTAGRPEISKVGNSAAQLVRQSDPAGADRVWPQQFEVAALGERQARSVSVLSDAREVRLEEVRQADDDVVIFNADGLGYGLFPAAMSDLDHWEWLDEVQRATQLINLRENLLAEADIEPGDYIQALQQIVAVEENDLLLDFALGQLAELYWNLLTVKERRDRASALENMLWDSMLTRAEPSQKKTFFEAFTDIAVTSQAVQKIYDVWAGKTEIGDLPLSENDHIDIAQVLAIKMPDRSASILESQLANTRNADSRRKLDYVVPSLSPQESVRDAFFESLTDEEMRQTESWVLTALGNLHHPLRREAAEKYLPTSLELLQEIQRTGDIFFPKRWLDVTLGSHHSDDAVRTVRDFLAENPDYNAQLRMKILQAADPVFRANRIMESE